MELQKWQKRLSKLNDRYKLAQQSMRKERLALAKADDQVVYCEQAQKLVQEVSQHIQQQVHNRIASVVSRCLKAVFDEPYKFKIHFELKRGRTEAKLVFVRKGQEIVPMQGSGGGVLDVAGFALRIACLKLSRPQLRPIVFLDEPFKFVSEEYRERVRQLIETLSEEMGIQFVMVTHIPELRTGKVVKVK
jgi:DNA repair exonuclease SbcCD ATPase subunit